MVDNDPENNKMDQGNQDSVTPIRDPLSLRNTDTGNLKRLIPGKAKKTIKLKPLVPGNSAVVAPEEGGAAIPHAVPVPKLDMSAASSKQTIRLQPIAPAEAPAPTLHPIPHSAKSSAATIMITPNGGVAGAAETQAGEEEAPMLESTETIKTMKIPKVKPPAESTGTLIPQANKSSVLLKAVPPHPSEAAIMPSAEAHAEVHAAAPGAPTISLKPVATPDALKSKAGLAPAAPGLHKPALQPAATTNAGAAKPTLTLKPTGHTVTGAPAAAPAPAEAPAAPKKVGLALNLNRKPAAPPVPVPPPAPAEEEAPAEEAAAPAAAPGGLSLPHKPVAPPPAPDGEKKAGLALKKTEGPSETEAAIAAEEATLLEGDGKGKKKKKKETKAKEAGATPAMVAVDDNEPGMVMSVLSMVATLLVICTLTMLTVQFVNHWTQRDRSNQIELPGLKGIEDRHYFWKKSEPSSYAPATAAPATHYKKPVPAKRAKAVEKN